MWLVRHLEITRQLVVEDLRVVKTLCQPCFPKDYDIVNTYVRMYHESIGEHVGIKCIQAFRLHGHWWLRRKEIDSVSKLASKTKKIL
jgi:hypothetical protein